MNRRLPTKAAPLLGLVGLVACATTKPAAQTAPADTTRPAPAVITPGTPTENLAKYRPVFAATGAGPATAPAAGAAPAPRVPAPPKAPAPTNQVNAQVEQRLRDQAFTNEKVKYTSGYRVRVYLGLERDQVMSIRRQIIARYPDETDYITFKQPVYRLYIGDYTNKLDAARGLARLRPLAPKAELEAMQVLVNKTP
ncbi:hypothetical protein HHL22_19795 [Hymenobacter sp. RP-2-7]|uniref:Sporulation protein n=1 Tax=Hymenobacter polaris TaxID=2682546 RepID=A0A7Y0FNY2_9BACT|nr:hypothetical protein [Hymenobacter polaris]NML67452.1 hypothetical protein [Hymenobacter polaris]